MAIPEIQQFRDLLKQKGEAKQKVMVAVGERNLAKLNGGDHSAQDKVIEAEGIDGGAEGKAFAAMQALADKVVSEHPELFANMRPFTEGGTFASIREGQPVQLTGLEMLVGMRAAFGAVGLLDEATLVDIFELASFERQSIGVAAQPQLRSARPGK